LTGQGGEPASILNCNEWQQIDHVSRAILTGFNVDYFAGKNSKYTLFDLHINDKSFGKVEEDRQIFLQGPV